MFWSGLNYRFVYQKYWAIIAVAVLTTGIGAFFASKLRLESDLATLLPNSFNSVQALEKIQDEVGGIGNLRIILESSDFDALKTAAHALEPGLTQSSFVKSLDYRNDIEFYKRNGLLLLESEQLDTLHQVIQDKIDEEKQKLNPLFVEDLFGDVSDNDQTTDFSDWEEKLEDAEPQEYYTNDDSTVLVIKVYPDQSNTSLSYVQEMYDEVRGIVESADLESFSPDLRVLYGGNFKNRLDEYNIVRDDILGTAVYGFGGVFLLIVIYFRRITGALLITITLLMSLAWTFGLTYLLIGYLNTITGFLFVILFGLGIDYGIHAFARYAESRRAGLTFEESIEKLVTQTGKALATTAMTTSAAFFSLIVMDFKGFSELGIISGIGILFALVAMVVVLPALITLLERVGLLRIQPGKTDAVALSSRPFPSPKPILSVAAVMTIVAFYGLFNVSFEYDFTNLRAITEEREKVNEKTSGVFKLSESPAVILCDSRDELPEVVDAVEAIMAADTSSPTVNAVRTVYSLVPPDQEEKLAKIREIRELIEDEAEGVVKGRDRELLDKLQGYLQVDEPFTWADFPEKDKRQFVNKDGEIGNFVFIYPGVPLRDGRNAIEFRNDIGEIVTPSGKTHYASSSNIILAEMLVILIREGKLAVGLTFLVVFVVVFLDFRSFRDALLVLSPLALGVLWMVGAMYVSSLKWNLFNIVVLPTIIGIGVDNGVHIYHRYLEEGRGSLMHVLRHTGWAITMTTMTTIVGYSGLIAAEHPGLNSIGELAVVGLICTYVTAVVVLPAILKFLESRRQAFGVSDKSTVVAGARAE